MPLKILTQEKIMQTNKHKHSDIGRFSTFNERISQKSPSLSTVNKFSDQH